MTWQTRPGEIHLRVSGQIETELDPSAAIAKERQIERVLIPR